MTPTQINRPCVITRRVASENRNELGQEGIETTTVETLCELQQQSSAEGAVDQTVDSSCVLFFRPEEEVGPGDAVWVVDEGDFDIVGEPNRLRNRRTQTYSHIEASAQRAGGPDENEEEGS